MNRKGFTLVELLMVVIIIGILVTLAVPNYYRSVERAKSGKAKGAMDAIRKAELQYRGANDQYTNTLADLEDYDLPLDLVDDGADADWTYSITTANTSELVINAERANGPHATSTLTMDQDGLISNVDGVGEWGS
ncbi:MAG: prepilin-type N-terminal cleavage/methylation domain-containing protein [Candidatus Omnitrophica bacterium]|jgi:prepilin-type N-terminal cleavage/methylation domain|nr:prepilin-type N-terminal cleavage/methylation domain-containing protein [Candidatus Omnitrophota bacterium]